MNGGSGSMLKWISRLLDGVVGLLATWVAICWLAVGLGWPFRTLLWLWPLAGMAMLVGVLWPAQRRQEPLPPVMVSEGGNAFLIPLAGALAGGIAFGAGWPWLAWAIAIAALLTWRWSSHAAVPRQPQSHEGVSSPVAPWLVGLGCLVAVLAVLLVNRPNIDDAFYLNAVQAAVEHPDQPVLTFDGMHGEVGWPLLNPIDKVMAYLPGVAVLSVMTGIPVVLLYHMVLPSLLAVLVVWVYALLLERTIGRGWWWALAGVLLIFLAWGSAPRNLGCFAFVRLFQGKAVLATLAVPAIVWYAWEFADRPSRRNWLLLAAVQMAAAGFCSSALVLGPLACGLAVLSTWQWDWRTTRNCALAGMTSLPCVAALGWVWLHYPAVEASAEQSTRGDLSTSLGLGFRGGLAFAAPLVVMAVAGQLRMTRIAGRYAMLIAVGLLCPALPWIMDKAAHNMAWRMAWAIPFPLLIMLAVVGLSRARYWPARWLGPAVAGGILAAFAFTGPWAVANKAAWGWHAAKFRSAQLQVAEAVIRRSRGGRVVLAPTGVATVMAALPGSPRLVAVTDRYLQLMSGAIGEQDVKRRLTLLRMVDEGGDEAIAAARPVLAEYRVDLIVLRRDLAEPQRIRDMLAEAGFTCEDRVSGFECWTHPNIGNGGAAGGGEPKRDGRGSVQR